MKHKALKTLLFTVTTGTILMMLSLVLQRDSFVSKEKTKTKTVGGIVFVYIHAGEPDAGRPEGNGKEPKDRPFWLGRYEVTQKQFEEVMGRNPSYFKGTNFPVDSVTWANADEFCRKFSAKFGVKARLPYGAEWEFACRAGSTTRFYWGDAINGKYCWNCDNADEMSHPVGQKLPNAWGLYDMSGNVSEWYQEKSSVARWARGGGWAWGDDSDLSCSDKGSGSTYFTDYDIGFRILLEE